MVKEGYKETEIGVIPYDWKIKYLSDVSSVVSGGTPSTTINEYWDGEIVWCTPSDITKTKGKYISKTDRTITEQGLKNSSATLLPEKSILLCTRATIGELKISSIPITTNQGFKNLIVNNSENVDFLYYLLQTKKNKMIDLAIGSTFLEISKSALCRIPLQIPEQKEQQKIAEALSNIDNLISSLEKLIEKKKAIKQGAMQELLTGKKRLSGFTKQWEIKTIEELCYLVTKQTGFDYSNEIKPSLVNSPLPYCIPFIQNKDFEGTSINFTTDYYIPKCVAEKYPKILLNETCLLISLSGKIGNVGLFTGDKLAFVGGAIGIARFYDKNIASWVMLYLQSEAGQKQIFESQKSGAQHNLTVEDVRKLKICLPSVDEQKAIADILFDVDAEITALEQKLAKCQKLKQGMMQQLLTGKIRLVSNDDVVTEKPEVDTLKVSFKGHNHQFDDAVVIAGIVDKFYSDKYPLGRKKVQKLLYLFRRHQEADTSAFKKKAAGPYADEVRYRGGEPIAISSKYISVKKGAKGSSFSKGEKIADALTYLENWNLNADLKWLCEQFKYIKTDKLELLATIDMAICDLTDAGITVTVDSIKNLIKSHSEWKEKLSKSYFKDTDIAWAIKECKKLFN